jgi:branched-subunit amino acid transport protein
MNEVLLVGGMALVTFAIRYPVLALLGRVSLPELALRALRYVPIAVLTAIVVPETLYPGGADRLQVGIGNAHLVGALVAGIVAWRTKSLLLTIVLGMAALWLWGALLRVL